MKYSLLFLLFMAALNFMSFSGCGTFHNGFSDSMSINSFAIAPDSNIYIIGDYLSPSTRGGIFKSTDNGQFWKETGEFTYEPYERSIRSLAVVNGNLFIPANVKGILKSSNNGADWIRTDHAYTTNFSILTSLPGEIILAGSRNGIFRSTDQGFSWHQTFLDSSFIYCFSNSEKYVLVGCDEGRIFVSEDAGVNWKLLKNFPSQKAVFALIITPENKLLAAVHEDGLYLSADIGSSWEQVIKDKQVFSIICHPTGDIFAGTYNAGILKSTNGGKVWFPINKGIDITKVNTLAVNRSGSVFAGTYRSLYRSDDGRTWKKSDRIYSEYGYQEETYGDSSRGGFVLRIRDRELFTGYASEENMGVYRLVMPFLSTMMVFKDQNYEKKFNVSYTSLLTLTMIMAGALVHYEDISEHAMTIRDILMVPILLAGSEHHLMLLAGNSLETSLFLVSRTDIFNKWWRYTTGGGIQIGFNDGKRDNPFYGSGIGIQIGVEKALLGKGIYDKNFRWYGGLNYVF